MLFFIFNFFFQLRLRFRFIHFQPLWNNKEFAVQISIQKIFILKFTFFRIILKFRLKSSLTINRFHSEFTGAYCKLYTNIYWSLMYHGLINVPFTFNTGIAIEVQGVRINHSYIVPSWYLSENIVILYIKFVEKSLSRRGRYVNPFHTMHSHSSSIDFQCRHYNWYTFYKHWSKLQCTLLIFIYQISLFLDEWHFTNPDWIILLLEFTFWFVS